MLFRSTGNVRKLLRLESLAVMLGAIWAYSYIHGHWGLFLLLFLVPDISFLAYLVGPRTGAFFYDAVHTYLGPILLMAAGALVTPLQPFALIWLAHIGFDRSLGYGLKYATGFSDTHLGQLARKR